MFSIILSLKLFGLAGLIGVVLPSLRVRLPPLSGDLGGTGGIGGTRKLFLEYIVRLSSVGGG